MPTPPRPGGVATAAMVSAGRLRVTTVSLCGFGFALALNTPGNEVLLCNGQGVVGYPIKYQSGREEQEDRKSTHLNSSHVAISYAVFCLKKKRGSSTKPTPSESIRDTADTGRRIMCGGAKTPS